MNHIRPGCRPSADYAADPGFLAQIAYSHLQWRLHGMPPEGKTGGVVFVADDLAAWLIGMLADAGRKKLTTLVLGSDQERALRQAAAAAIESTAAELDPSGGERAGQLA